MSVDAMTIRKMCIIPFVAFCSGCPGPVDPSIVDRFAPVRHQVFIDGELVYGRAGMELFITNIFASEGTECISNQFLTSGDLHVSTIDGRSSDRTTSLTVVVPVQFELGLEEGWLLGTSAEVTGSVDDLQWTVALNEPHICTVTKFAFTDGNGIEGDSRCVPVASARIEIALEPGATTFTCMSTTTTSFEHCVQGEDTSVIECEEP